MMMDKMVRPEPDFQHLLPRSMQAKWAVVPRFFLYQLCVVCALLGAGFAMSVVGWVTGNGWLPWAFPIALAVCWLQNKALSRYERRLINSAAQHLPRDAIRSGY